MTYYWIKYFLKYCWKCIISQKWIFKPQKETSCHTFKMTIFSKFFVDIMTHIIRWNAGEKIKSIFELFTKQKNGFRFVLFLSVQTLRTDQGTYCLLRNPCSLAFNGAVRSPPKIIILIPHRARARVSLPPPAPPPPWPSPYSAPWTKYGSICCCGE